MISPARLALCTALAMLAFAANSLLCRAALKGTGIDAATFTSGRLVAGALVLGLLVKGRGSVPSKARAGSWPMALALFVYAIAFSFAYSRLPTAVGALILFGAVQSTMIGYGLWSGEKLRARQFAGLALALGGLVGLLLPGLSAPPLGSAALMAGAGMAWGVYSLLGKGARDPTAATAGNFLRTIPLAALLTLLWLPHALPPFAGLVEAMVSGAIASGLGYVLWYAALPGLPATMAATIQLSVPVLAAVGGVVFLGESITWRLLFCSLAILGGIALFIRTRQLPRTQPPKTR